MAAQRIRTVQSVARAFGFQARRMWVQSLVAAVYKKVSLSKMSTNPSLVLNII